jgi:sulfatase maturation enzyme AslB (radical SAM superfamily)
MRALQILARTRTHPEQRVNMISVVMDDNVDDIERLVEQSAAMGVTYLVTLYSHARGTKPSQGGERDLGARLLEIKRRHRHFVALRGYLERFGDACAEGVAPCRAGRNLWNIDCQGNVTLCIDKLDDPAGNILHDDMAALEKRLLEAHDQNTCSGCWTSCRGPIETLMYGKERLANLADYYQLTRDVALGRSF